MYVCLSSGSTPRYRQDVLRAVALPRGIELQFRYRLKWLSPQTVTALDDIPSDARALIAYIDQTDKARTPILVPCRFAQIVGVMKHGKTVSLTLRLDGFAVAEDLNAANVEIRKLAPDLANYAECNLTGFYWAKASAAPTNVTESAELSPWESIVELLFQHSDFSSEPFFEMVAGIFAPDGAFVPATDGRLVLSGAGDHEVRVYHYHPKSAPEKPVSLKVAATSPLLHFSTSASALIDSPYDLKRFRFRTSPSVDADESVLTITASGENLPTSVPELDVPIRIDPRRGRYAMYGIAAGLLLAVPQVTAAFSAQNIPDNRRLWQAGIAIVFSVLAGLIGAFGLKKL